MAGAPAPQLSSRSPTTAPAVPHSAVVTSRWATARIIRGPRADTRTPCSWAAAATPAAGRALGVEHHDVRLHRAEVDGPGGSSATASAKARRGGVVLGQPGEMVVQRVRSPGREDAGLPPPTAQPLAPDPSQGDLLRAADQHRPDRGAQALGEADAHGVEQPAVLGRPTPGGHVRVPQPAPSRWSRAPLPAQGRDTLASWSGWMRPAAEVVGVLHRDGRGGHQVGPGVGRDDRRDLRHIQPAAHRRVGAHGQPVHCGVRAHLGAGDVGCASQITSSPGSTSSRTPSRLASDPLSNTRVVE